MPAPGSSENVTVQMQCVWARAWSPETPLGIPLKRGSLGKLNRPPLSQTPILLLGAA